MQIRNSENAHVTEIINAILREQKYFSAKALREQKERQQLNEENFIAELRQRLLNLLLTEQAFIPPYQPAVYDLIYLNLINLTKHWPINNIEDGKPIDPCSWMPIEEHHLALTASGYQFDLESNKDWFVNHNVNPATQTALNRRDKDQLGIHDNPPQITQRHLGYVFPCAIAGSGIGTAIALFVMIGIALAMAIYCPWTYLLIGAAAGIFLGAGLGLYCGDFFDVLIDKLRYHAPEPWQKKLNDLDKNANERKIDKGIKKNNDSLNMPCDVKQNQKPTQEKLSINHAILFPTKNVLDEKQSPALQLENAIALLHDEAMQFLNIKEISNALSDLKQQLTHLAEYKSFNHVRFHQNSSRLIFRMNEMQRQDHEPQVMSGKYTPYDNCVANLYKIQNCVSKIKDTFIKEKDRHEQSRLALNQGQRK